MTEDVVNGQQEEPEIQDTDYCRSCLWSDIPCYVCIVLPKASGICVLMQIDCLKLKVLDAVMVCAALSLPSSNDKGQVATVNRIYQM